MERTGFTVTKVATGTYEVEYNTSFNDTPAVTLTQNYRDWNDFGYEGGDTRDNCVLVASNRNKFKLITGDSPGDHTDRNFTFIAIGS
ncbi:MAG: hypothetical protein F6K36_19985 [Symploca sp. SIO3C6]|nr:hypothetical protein [Symploca sp. SIO3C6]NET08322.1 hypothetical protein [Symploca sp. SIO2B6]NET51145.1 hypothetical protein [Merismopedia sp. SIO2A8]